MKNTNDVHLPNFFVLGASKAGSTSLNFYLDQHPEIYMGADKEPEFFQNDEDYKKGLNWYVKTYFSKADFNCPVGEASASYLYYSKVANRLSKLPQENQRFIVLLRDPVDRAYSQYWHQVRRGETRTFKHAIDDEFNLLGYSINSIFNYPPESYYLGRSMYYEHLANYMKHFRREQFLLVFLDELKSSPQKVFDKICDFLSVPRYKAISTDKIHNSGATSSLRLQVNRLKNSRIYGLFKTLNIKTPRSVSWVITKGFGKTDKYPKLSDELRKKLIDFFRSDITKLESLFDSDEYIPDWFKEYTKKQ